MRVSCHQPCHLWRLPATQLRRSVGRSLSPSVVRPCAWHAGSTAAWGPDRAAVAWGAYPPLRWAGAALCVGRGGQDSVRLPVSPRPRPHGSWAPARRPAAQPAAQHRSQQTPLARPSTWAFFRAPSRAVARLGLRTLPAALLKLALGGPSTRAFSGHARGVPPRRQRGADPRRRNVGRSCEAALGGRRRSRGARRAGLGTPAGIAAPTRAWVVGARPPPRCQPSRPTTLAADTAGAAPNLGVF